MKKIYLTGLVCVLFTFNVQGQISTDEIPVSFKKDVSLLQSIKVMEKTLPSIDLQQLQQEDAADEINGIPPRFGYRYKVDYNPENSGTWTDLPDGDRI